MSLVYYSVESTEGLPFLNVAAVQSLPWSTPDLLNDLYQYLSSLDFSEYDLRKQALKRIRSTYLPEPPFYTFSFDPLEPPVPLVQYRFSPSGVYVSLSGDYTSILVNISRSLSIVDSDINFETYRTLFYTNLAALFANISSSHLYFDRLTFETTYILLWAPFPPVI